MCDFFWICLLGKIKYLKINCFEYIEWNEQICSIWGIIVVSLMVVNVTAMQNMSTPEAQAYTVMKKQEYRYKIKKEALKILVWINRRTPPKDAKSRYTKTPLSKQVILAQLKVNFRHILARFVNKGNA